MKTFCSNYRNSLWVWTLSRKKLSSQHTFTCSNSTIETLEKIFLYRFHTFFWCFYCWLWTGKCLLVWPYHTNLEILEVIKSAHSSLCASTSFREIYREPSQTTIGPKQGNPLSTTLFNICVSDLPTFLENPQFSEKLTLANHAIDYLHFDEDLEITAASEK